MPTRTTRIGSRTLIATLALTAGSSPTLAQDALGNGHELENSLYVDTYVGGGAALDNPLRLDTRFNPARPDFAAELRFRNAIATGNAPGGLSFRGDVGYTAPGEFRGELGSDTLYPFRRDSLYSGLGGMGIRGTEALQYQFALTTGARVPRDVMGSLFVPREVGGVSTSGGPSAPTIGRVTDPDSVGTLYGQIRSPSTYTANRGYAPFLLTTRTGRTTDGEERDYAITATPLRGIKAEPMTDSEQLIAAMRAPSTLDESGRPETTRQDSGRIETAYDEVLRRLRQRAEGTEGETTTPAEEGQTPEWMRQLDELRRQLMGELTEPKTPDGQTPAPDGTDQPAPDATTPNGQPAQTGTKNPNPTDPVQIRFDEKTMQLLRESGEPLDQLVASDATPGDLYAEHLRAGERLLAGGQYFDAEERFTRALSLRQGDVTAQIGRVHAQLGAGMFLSAAINLRTTLLGAPSIVTTRYAPSLLPRPDRIKDLKLALRENVGLVARPGIAVPLDPRVQRESAFLLAYLGYQTDDQTAVRDGLAEFKRRIETGRQADGVDARLAELLTTLWVRPGSGEE